MRTFIAIDLPEPVRDSLLALSERLRTSRVRASWLKPEAMHLTLRFLGEVSEEDAARFGVDVAERVRGFAPIPLSVSGVGAFPNSRAPSVVWAGVSPDEGPLADVQRITEEAAQAIGLKPERRAFHPHLTLARIREPQQARPLMALLAHERDFSGGSFDANRLVLYKSRLTPQGAIYTAIQECPFC